MKTVHGVGALVLAVVAWSPALAQTAGETIPVTTDNFVRAESDLYLSGILKDSGTVGKFNHNREPAQIDNQTVIRLNRDTLYSSAVFDLDAGPVTITLPDGGDRFMSMQVINEDHYVPEVNYGAGSYTLDREKANTRYVAVAIRTLVDPADPEDVQQVHALQDAIMVEQPGGPGTFEVPNWDQESQKKVRDALLVLQSTLPDFRKAFGSKDEVDPIRHLLGTAAGWGGNPDRDAVYLNVTPDGNDGTTVYKLQVGDVPVDGFWSVSLYMATATSKRAPTIPIRSTTSPPRRATTGRSTSSSAAATQDSKLPADHEGLEPYRPPLPPASGDTGRLLEVPGAAAGRRYRSTGCANL
jgi:hypothetical protein